MGSGSSRCPDSVCVGHVANAADVEHRRHGCGRKTARRHDPQRGGALALPPSIWLGSAFGIEGVAVAYSLASLVCGELPSFVLTTRELSLRRLTVLGRLRGIALSCVATCVAAVFVRQALEDGGIGSEPRVLVSVIVGAVVYVSCLTLFARSIARQLVRMAAWSSARPATQGLTWTIGRLSGGE